MMHRLTRAAPSDCLIGLDGTLKKLLINMKVSYLEVEYFCPSRGRENFGGKRLKPGSIFYHRGDISTCLYLLTRPNDR